MNYIYKNIMNVGVLALVVMSTGCASTGTRRIPVDRERPLTSKFDADDVRRTVDFMVEDLLEANIDFSDFAQSSQPVLDIAKFKNDSMQHINTRSIMDSMRTRLLRSGKFRFKDRLTTRDDLTFMNEENEVGMVDRRKVILPGQQSATELYLYGALVEMRTDRGMIRDAYYKITLNMKDLRSGEIIWANEREIRKEQRRGLIGY